MLLDLQFDVSKSDLWGLAFAAGGFIAAFVAQSLVNWKSALAVLFFAIGLAIMFWPSPNYEDDIDFLTESTASRCVEVRIKAPDVKGMHLWLSQSENEATWILRPGMRKERQDDGRYVWTQRMTLGPPKAPTGAQYRVYAFYLSTAESSFLQGIKGRAPSDSRQASEGDSYWTSQSLPTGAPSKSPLHIITRRNSDSPEPSC